VHIRFCGDGGWQFRFYSDSLLQTPKRKQNALPLHSVPRCGSACPRTGNAPGGPLRNTCVRPLGKGQQIKIKSQSNGNGNGNGNGKINSFASKSNRRTAAPT
jgi:hypothetical protein